MSQEQIKNKIINIIAKAIQVDKKKITMNSKSKEYQSWDSIAQLTIISELDKLFKGKLSNASDLSSMDSVSNILKLLNKKKLI
jgi:acyl carrier protein